MAALKAPVAAHQVTVDAAGQTLGRVASRVATLLRGKHLVSFRPNLLPAVQVTVTNVAELRFTGTKLTTKQYYRFSGYPGGIKTTTLQQEFTKNPAELLRRSVAHMLPKNRLQSRLLKQLTIYRGATPTK